MPSRTDSPLQVAIIGAGLGGLAAAVALRRQGHTVTVYERYDFAGEVGASLSAASNGSRFLEEWGVDVKAAKPVCQNINPGADRCIPNQEIGDLEAANYAQLVQWRSAEHIPTGRLQIQIWHCTKVN